MHLASSGILRLAINASTTMDQEKATKLSKEKDLDGQRLHKTATRGFKTKRKEGKIALRSLQSKTTHQGLQHKL
ncbi:hypothetical protein V6N12_000828 [Hibiscus sabdariffa]|uniref:Uncharacterized protein n=1 Tax=Hibiscus sabdariffa TaxID=183260 RepID=A0ABR2BXD8_9ROSI